MALAGPFARLQQTGQQRLIPRLEGDEAQFVTSDIHRARRYPLPRAEKPSDATPIIVPATLEAPDPLVRTTLKVLSKAQVYEGRLLTKGSTVLAVRISRTAVDRAMLLLDTLLKVCRAAGMPWTITEKGTFVQCDGVELKVILRERFTKQEVKPELRPLRAARTSRSGRSPNRCVNSCSSWRGPRRPRAGSASAWRAG